MGNRHSLETGADGSATGKCLSPFSFKLGWKDSNLRMAIPKTAALPLGDTPSRVVKPKHRLFSPFPAIKIIYLGCVSNNLLERSDASVKPGFKRDYLLAYFRFLLGGLPQGMTTLATNALYRSRNQNLDLLSLAIKNNPISFIEI